MTEGLNAWSWWNFPELSRGIPRCSTNQFPQSTPHANDEDGLHTSKFPLGENWDQGGLERKWVTQQGPQQEAQREARSQYKKSVWTHEDAELCEAGEKVRALEHRWSAAAEDLFLKTSEAGHIRSCVGTGTMLRHEQRQSYSMWQKTIAMWKQERPEFGQALSARIAAHWHGESRACRHARRNREASGTGTTRHATSSCVTCSHSNNKHSPPRHAIGQPNQRAILCQA